MVPAVANQKNIMDFASKLGLKGTFDEICKNKAVRTMVIYNFEETMATKVSKYEIPQKIALITEPFSVENGLLTNVMKTKRKEIEARYKHITDLMYVPYAEEPELQHTIESPNN